MKKFAKLNAMIITCIIIGMFSVSAAAVQRIPAYKCPDCESGQLHLLLAHGKLLYTTIQPSRAVMVGAVVPTICMICVKER